MGPLPGTAGLNRLSPGLMLGRVVTPWSDHRPPITLFYISSCISILYLFSFIDVVSFISCILCHTLFLLSFVFAFCLSFININFDLGSYVSYPISCILHRISNTIDLLYFSFILILESLFISIWSFLFRYFSICVFVYPLAFMCYLLPFSVACILYR